MLFVRMCRPTTCVGISSQAVFSRVKWSDAILQSLSSRCGQFLCEKKQFFNLLQIGSRPLPDTLENIGSSSAKLPPVKSNKKKPGKSSKRCFLCTKKTGLATSYVCR